MSGILVLLFSATALAADSVQDYHVQEYVRKGQYLLGAPLTVTGRVAILNKTELRFRNCRVPFRSTIGTLRVPERTRTVAVTGRTVQDTDPQSGVQQTVFLVDSIKPADDDLSVFHYRQSRLPPNGPPESWYALAEWAEGRGTFYSDRELLARADEAFLRGAQAERRQLAANNPDGLLTLAEKLAARGLPESTQTELIHEYFVRMIGLARAADKVQRPKLLVALVDELGRRMPSSLRPLSVVERTLDAEYRKSPAKTFEAADSKTRARLARYLALDVREELLLGEVLEDGSNALEIAQKIDEKLPERHAKAEELREKALERQAREVDTKSRAELLELAKIYRDRKDHATADRLIESWLRVRLRKLPPDDLEGRMEIAELYRTLLRQPETANRMLLEAAKDHPESPVLKSRLEEAGYTWHEGAWLSKDEFNSRPEAEQDRARRNGRVIPGMAASVVRQIRGIPESVARSVSRGQVNEVWTYTLSDKSRLLVHLTRFAFRGGEPQVTESTVVRP